MWLLAFALLALVIGYDLRKRGLEASLVSAEGTWSHLTGLNVRAIGGWTSFAGGISLNLAVFSLF